jgi:prepilin-type N-terminal cleavage/methylation domain-containing protein
MSARSGVTLLELTVTIAIIAIIAGVVGLAVARTPSAPPDKQLAAAIRRLRTAAVRSGRPVAIDLSYRAARYTVTALPDGRILADSIFGIDPFSGQVEDASR